MTDAAPIKASEDAKRYPMLAALCSLLRRSWSTLLSLLSTSTTSVVVFSIAVPFLVWFATLYYGVKQEGKQFVWQTILDSLLSWPTLIAAAITGLAWGGLFLYSIARAIYNDHQALIASNSALQKENAELRLARIPKLQFGDTRVIPTPTTTNTGEPGANRVVGQILVKLCSPDVPVSDCTGQLLRVWKWSDVDKDWKLTDADEPVNLLWSVIDKPVHTLNTDWQLCVFAIDNVIDRHLHLWADRVQYRTIEVFKNADPKDIFKFDISVSGKDCPTINVSLKVQMGNQWDKPTFEPIPN